MGGRLYRQLGTYAVVLLGAMPAFASERNAGDKRRSPAVAGRVALCVVFLVIFVFILRGGFADFFHDDGIGFVANGCRFKRIDFFQAQAVHPVVAEVEAVVDEIFFLQLRVVEGEGRGVVGDIAFIHHHVGIFHAVRVKNPLFAIV